MLLRLEMESMVRVGSWVIVGAVWVQLSGCAGKSSSREGGDTGDSTASASDTTSSASDGGGGTLGEAGSGGNGQSGGSSSGGARSGAFSTSSVSGSGGTGGSGGDGDAASTAAATSSGGGTGDSGGNGGSGGAVCGDPSSGLPCPEGQFCDLPSQCGEASEPVGVCVPRLVYEDCEETAEPVCGCEGRTYTNDCLRQAAGMLKAAEGVCTSNEIVSYPTSYLVWRASNDEGGTGPAAVVSAAMGSVGTWADVSSFSPEEPPSDSAQTFPLTQGDVDSLFLRIAGIRASDLPHDPAAAGDCRATLYYRPCKGCAINSVTYGDPESVTPELEPLWSWFDQIVGETDPKNPRNYCN